MKLMTIRGVGLLALLPLLISACTDDFTPEYVDSVVVFPGTIFTVVGDEVALSAEVSGPRGQTYPDRASRVEWSVANPAIATLEFSVDGVFVRGLQLGATRVTAVLGRGTGSALVYVEPAALDHITISPSPVEISFPGSRGVTAQLWDASGNQLNPADYHLQWTTGDESIATLLYKDATPTSVRARSRGQTTLILRAGGKTASTTIRVN